MFESPEHPSRNIEEALRPFVEALDVAEERVAQAKFDRNEARLALIERAVAAGKQADDADEAIRVLYWDYLELNVDVIGEAFGLRTHEVSQHAGAVLTDHDCRGCGKALMARSRTEWDRLEKDSDRPFRRQCDACEEEERTRRSAQWRERSDWEASRLRELRAMPYREYLQSPEWDETRRAALRRARYRCQLCNADRPLDVHHRTYERLGRERNADVIALCRLCHATFHRQLDLERET